MSNSKRKISRWRAFRRKHYGLRIFEILCRLLPLRNTIVYDNFAGRGFGDDGKYIAHYIIGRDAPVQQIWLVKNPDPLMPTEIKQVKYESFAAVYHQCTSRVWVDNIRNSWRVKKRKGQFYVQTWHGILGLKQIEGSVASLLEPDYIENAKKDSAITDLMYSNNDVYKSRFENTFWYNGKVIRSGSPKVSVLLENNPAIREKIHRHFNLEHDTKIMLYAPTFRKDKSMDAYRWDYEKILGLMEQRFGGKFVMLLRLHPNIAKSADFVQYTSKVIAATSYPDMQELLSASDILITDYSSSMFEFGITQKPVFLLCKDAEQYKNADRTLEFEYEELPYNFCKSELELESSIRNFDLAAYASTLQAFHKKINLQDKGDGAKTIGDIILKRLGL